MGCLGCERARAPSVVGAFALAQRCVHACTRRSKADDALARRKRNAPGRGADGTPCTIEDIAL
jgi:hypothetical protein